MFLRTAASTQPSLPSFGARIDFVPGFKPSCVEAVLLGDSGETMIAAADPASRLVHLYRVEPSGLLATEAEEATPFGVSDMQWGKTPDRQSYLIHPRQKRFAVMGPADGDGPRPVNLFQVEYDRFVTTDLNNDRTSDILFFGKQATGISTHLGGEGRITAPWKTIVPEISVSDVVTTDLNGDGIVDLFVADWVSNRIVLYIGIGRGVFSEQISHQLPGEPDRLAFVGDPARRRNQLAVTIPERREIHLLSVNSLGEIIPESRLYPVIDPLGVRFVDVNDDGHHDVISATRNECLLFLTEPSGIGSQRIPYGVEGELVDWDLADFDGNGTPDLLLATNNPSKLIIIRNQASGQPNVSWPQRYSSASFPRAVATGDFDGDGLEDVAVVSPAAGICSFFLNAGEGQFRGQMVVPLPNNPYSIRALLTTASGDPTFLISHSSSDEVTVLRPFARSTDTPVQFTIPTDRLPLVIAADLAGASRSLSFLTRNGGRNAGGLTVSLFEQLSDDQFIETTIRPTISQQITAITSADLTGDLIPDLLFATPDQKTRSVRLLIARGIDRTTFHPAEQLFSLPDSGNVEIMVQVADLDRDRQTDIILALGPPHNSLIILYPAAGGGSVDSVLWIRGVDVQDEEALRITDLDGDGDIDFCAVDRKSKTIIMIPGKGKRRFGKPRPIAQGTGVSAIAVGSFQSTDSRDLVIVNASESVISFLFDPFRD